MHTVADAFSRPGTGQSPPSWEANGWLGAIAATLGFAVIALLILPGALVLPAMAVGLFLASVIPVVAARREPPARRERARLFAGMLFAFGILAAAFTDLDRVAALLG